MKKIVYLFLLLVITTAGMSQEWINVAGVGYQTGPQTRGDYEFLETRLMLGNQFRVGPYFNITWGYQACQGFYWQGRNITAGLSLDFWGQGFRYSHYGWLNTGYRWSVDRGSDGQYQSWQRDGLLALNGGFRLTSFWLGWFGNHLIMAEFQTPLNSKIIATYQNDTIDGATLYQKRSLRLCYENGIKQFPVYIAMREIRLEPLLALGFNYQWAEQRQFLEYGIGLSLGMMTNYYHELGKIKISRSHDLGSYQSEFSRTKPTIWQLELILNINWSMKKK